MAQKTEDADEDKTAVLLD